MREQTAPEVYAPGVTAHNGAACRGRIRQRRLIELTCGRCGADLLSNLADVLLHGCACTRPPLLRRVR